MRFFLFFGLICFSLSSFAALEKFIIKSGDFEASFLLSPLMPQEYRQMLKEDLRFIASIPKTNVGTPLHHKVFGGPVSGETYLRWLEQRMYRIKYTEAKRYEAAVAFNRKNPNIFLRGNNKKRHSVFFTPATYFDSDRIERLATIIHEARHTDGFQHVNCQEPGDLDMYDRLSHNFSVEGKACDTVAWGSYGAELIFKFNLLKAFPDYLGDNFHENEGDQIVSREARRLLNEDLIGPMVPLSLFDAVGWNDAMAVERFYEQHQEKGEQVYLDGIAQSLILEALDHSSYLVIEKLYDLGLSGKAIFHVFDINCSWVWNAHLFSFEFLEQLFGPIGVDINKPAGDMRRILHFAVLNYPDSKNLVEHLVDWGANPCLKNLYGENVLQYYRRMQQLRGNESSDEFFKNLEDLRSVLGTCPTR